MCADCHSTNVKKGFSRGDQHATRRPGRSSNVSCEACHGPGSAHVAWAEAVKAGKAKTDDADKGLAVALNDHDKATWDFDMKTGIAKRSVPRTSHAEVETCARCHARRSVVADDYVFGQPLMQTHRPALLDEGLYFADGQIEDEVYEYGSFLQSKMHAAGVTCSNCHNPHDLKVPVLGGPRLRDLPPAREVRHAGAPLPQGRLARRALRRLPHADAQLHGRARAPRPQLPRAAAGPLGLARDAERLHAVPPRTSRTRGPPTPRCGGGATRCGRSRTTAR